MFRNLPITTLEEKIENKIKSQALQRRLFKILEDEIECQFGELNFTLEFDSWVENDCQIVLMMSYLPQFNFSFLKQFDKPNPEL